MASAPAPKEYVLKGFSNVLDGRSIRFVDQLPVGLPVCSLCSVVPFEHYSLSCKHVYCGPCFLESVKVSTTLRCPMDGKLLRPRRAAPLATADVDMLRSLVACCWNKDYGCSYTGNLEDLEAHVRDCYEVTCGLCSGKLLRSRLVGHLETAHSGTRKTSSRKAKRREEAVVASAEASSGPLAERGNGDAEHEGGAVTGEKAAATPAGTKTTQLSHERVLELIEATATRTASKAADDVKKVNGTMLRDILGAIEMINHRLTQHERLTAVAFTGSSRAEDAAPAAVFERPRKQEHVDGYTWTVCQYSKIRVGIHYVVSPLFVIAPGYRVQLTICIDGITLVELSASVKVHRGDGDNQPLEWPFQRTCLFTLFDKSGHGAHVTSLFTPKDLFNSPVTASPSTGDDSLVSGWLTVSKMTRLAFERDYIENDGFTLAFSTNPSLQ